jgi:ABC-type Zn uptake system ZnuABC Zn-binding protein ZnuA
MKILILSSVLFLTGCASTKNEYAINGQTEPLKIIGSMIVIGVVAKSIAKPGTNSCVSTIKNQQGQTIGTSTIVKQGQC